MITGKCFLTTTWCDKWISSNSSEAAAHWYRIRGHHDISWTLKTLEGFQLVRIPDWSWFLIDGDGGGCCRNDAFHRGHVRLQLVQLFHRYLFWPLLGHPVPLGRDFRTPNPQFDQELLMSNPPLSLHDLDTHGGDGQADEQESGTHHRKPPVCLRRFLESQRFNFETRMIINESDCSQETKTEEKAVNQLPIMVGSKYQGPKEQVWGHQTEEDPKRDPGRTVVTAFIEDIEIFGILKFSFCLATAKEDLILLVHFEGCRCAVVIGILMTPSGSLSEAATAFGIKPFEPIGHQGSNHRQVNEKDWDANEREYHGQGFSCWKALNSSWSLSSPGIFFFH